MRHRLLLARRQSQEEAAFADAEARLVGALQLAQRGFAMSIIADGKSPQSLIERTVLRLEKAHRETDETLSHLRMTVDRVEQVLAGSLKQTEASTAGIQAMTVALRPQR